MKLTRLAAATGILAAATIGGVAVAAPATAYPAGQIFQASISATVVPAGGQITVSVSNATPGQLTLQIFSAPVTIGTGTVGSDFTGSVTGTIPAGYSGAHTIQVIGAGAGEVRTFQIEVTSGGGGGTGGGQGGGSGTGGGGGLANTGAAVTGIGVLGGLLVAGGVFFVVAGRRRTAANQTTSL